MMATDGSAPAAKTATAPAAPAGAQKLAQPRCAEQQREPAGGAPLPPPPLPPPRLRAACSTVRHACDLLALPSRVACTAITFLHRVAVEELSAEVSCSVHARWLPYADGA